jgi:hypothetical protein
VAGVTSDDGKFVYDKLKLVYTQVPDIHNIAAHSGMIVLGGQAFFVTVPSMPHFMLHEQKMLLMKEKQCCSKTEQEHALHTVAILKDPEGQGTHSILFVLLDGTVTYSS